MAGPRTKLRTSSATVRLLAGAAVVGALVLAVSAPGHAGKHGRARCFSDPVTSFGTKSDDVLRGTRGDDVISARDGDDVVLGRGGDDVICAGGGDDVVHADGNVSGGGGDDRLKGDGVVDGVFKGGPGDDRIGNFEPAGKGDYRNDVYGSLSGGRGDDAIRGGKHLYGGAGDDRLKGTTLADHISPGPGDDVVRGIHNDFDPSEDPGPPHDVLDYRRSPRPVRVDLQEGVATGWGHDTFSGLHRVKGSRFDDVLIGLRDRREPPGSEHPQLEFEVAHDSLDGWRGDDVLRGLAGDDSLDGGPGDDLLRAGPGRDDMDGDDGDDSLFGGPGGERIFGSAGDDHFDGGPGQDYIDLYTGKSGPAVRVDLRAGTVEGDGNDTVTGIEQIGGTERADVLLGGPGDDHFESLDGRDVVRGRGGDDFFDLGYGVDGRSLHGGAGRDAISFDDFGGLTFVDLGRDILLQHRKKAPFRLVTLLLPDLPPHFRPGPRFDSLAGIESVVASPYRDYIVGGPEPNLIVGSGGNDHIEGKGGDDYLVGGDLNDHIFGGAGDDVVVGDCRGLRYRTESLYQYDCSAWKDRLFGGRGDDVLLGDCAFLRSVREHCDTWYRDRIHGGAGVDASMPCLVERKREDRHADGAFLNDVLIHVEATERCNRAALFSFRSAHR